MLIYTIKEAKRDFDIGYLSDFQLSRVPMSKNWAVYLKGGGMAQGWLVDARKKEPRQFCTLDAAVSVLEEIGFKVEGLLRG